MCTQSTRGGQEGPEPPIFWINENKCVFNKHRIKVGCSCSCRCPGTFLGAKHATPNSAIVSLSFRKQHTRRGPRRALCKLKKPFKSPRPIFYLSGLLNIWLLASSLKDTQMLCGCADALATRRLKASFLNGKLPLSSWCPVPLPLYLPTPPPQYSYLQGTANVCRSNIEKKRVSRST